MPLFRHGRTGSTIAMRPQPYEITMGYVHVLPARLQERHLRSFHSGARRPGLTLNAPPM